MKMKRRVSSSSGPAKKKPRIALKQDPPVTKPCNPAPIVEPQLEGPQSQPTAPPEPHDQDAVSCLDGIVVGKIFQETYQLIFRQTFMKNA